jgi:hypothetical protein
MQKLFVILSILFSAQGFAQVSASAVVNTVVRVVEPITIQKSLDLNFGNVLSSYNPGSLILSPDGTRTAVGVQISNAVQGEVSPAQAVVTHGNNDYSITLPDSFILYNQRNPNQTILINQFKVEPFIYSGIEGADILRIGATLNLEANQIPGLYTNSTGFSVTVTYN